MNQEGPSGEDLAFLNVGRARDQFERLMNTIKTNQELTRRESTGGGQYSNEELLAAVTAFVRDRVEAHMRSDANDKKRKKPKKYGVGNIRDLLSHDLVPKMHPPTRGNVRIDNIDRVIKPYSVPGTSAPHAHDSPVSPTPSGVQSSHPQQQPRESLTTTTHPGPSGTVTTQPGTLQASASSQDNYSFAPLAEDTSYTEPQESYQDPNYLLPNHAQYPVYGAHDGNTLFDVGPTFQPFNTAPAISAGPSHTVYPQVYSPIAMPGPWDHMQSQQDHYYTPDMSATLPWNGPPAPYIATASNLQQWDGIYHPQTNIYPATMGSTSMTAPFVPTPGPPDPVVGQKRKQLPLDAIQGQQELAQRAIKRHKRGGSFSRAISNSPQWSTVTTLSASSSAVSSPYLSSPYLFDSPTFTTPSPDIAHALQDRLLFSEAYDQGVGANGAEGAEDWTAQAQAADGDAVYYHEDNVDNDRVGPVPVSQGLLSFENVGEEGAEDWAAQAQAADGNAVYYHEENGNSLVPVSQDLLAFENVGGAGAEDWAAQAPAAGDDAVYPHEENGNDHDGPVPDSQDWLTFESINGGREEDTAAQAQPTDGDAVYGHEDNNDDDDHHAYDDNNVQELEQHSTAVSADDTPPQVPTETEQPVVDGVAPIDPALGLEQVTSGDIVHTDGLPFSDESDDFINNFFLEFDHDLPTTDLDWALYADALPFPDGNFAN